MRFKISILFTLLCAFPVMAQQEALYTHYMYNTLVVNPAYAGSRDALTVTALGRFQWVGFDGAPNTQTLTAHAPVVSKNIGLGLSVVNDQIGPVHNTSFAVDFAYRLKINDRSRLSFGLKGGIDNLSAQTTSLTLQQQNDNAFSQALRNQVKPNFGFGLYYSRERFYAGISAPKLLENDYKSGNGLSGLDEIRHYYFIMGSVFRINPAIRFKPTTMVRVTNGAPLQIDLSAQFFIHDRFNIGAMYRAGDAFGILAGVNISEQFLLGYSFDFSYTNSTARYNQGSHEVMLRYDFIFHREGRISSPRYF